MLSLFVSLWLSAAAPSSDAGWFYRSRLPLLTYPGAYSFMIDGPFKTEADCKAVREAELQMIQALGVKVETWPCFERKSA